MTELLDRGVYYLAMSIWFFTAASFVEFVWSHVIRRRKDRDLKESLANFGVSAVRQVLRFTLTGGIVVAVLKFFEPFQIAKLPVNGWTLALTLLVADFIYYWNHRLSHEVRLLWSYHAVHHSSKEFNLSTAIRLPWIDWLDALFYVPAVLVGFDPLALALSKGIVLIYQYWIHSDSIGKLGVLEGVVNTPSAHRVHHGSNPQYLDRNHGGILMIWDRMFGTYVPETEPVVFGLTKPIGTYNPFVINFMEPLAIVRDVLSARTWREACGYVFCGPGWKPGKPRLFGSLTLAAASNTPDSMTTLGVRDEPQSRVGLGRRLRQL